MTEEDLVVRFETIAKAHLELSVAVQAVAAHLYGIIEGAELVERDVLVRRIEAMANLAGDVLANVGGEAQVPNSHLIGIAVAVREGLSGASPLRVVGDEKTKT